MNLLVEDGAAGARKANTKSARVECFVVTGLSQSGGFWVKRGLRLDSVWKCVCDLRYRAVISASRDVPLGILRAA